MADEWGSVDGKRSAREVETLRQRYRSHRDALSRMAADAPTETLATEYARLMSGIDRSLEKLNELDRGAAAPSDGSLDATQVFDPRESHAAGEKLLDAELPTQPRRPSYVESPLPAGGSPMRILLIAVVGIAVLAVLYFLVTRASARKGNDRIVEGDTNVTSTGTPAVVTEAPAVADTAPAAPASPLSMKPDSIDYGAVRKGTRAVRQYDVLNSSAAAVPITVARSGCKCLFYEYAKVVPAKGKSTVTVAVDGGRAKPGALEETLAVTSKGDPNAATSFTVKATIK